MAWKEGGKKEVKREGKKKGRRRKKERIKKNEGNMSFFLGLGDGGDLRFLI